MQVLSKSNNLKNKSTTRFLIITLHRKIITVPKPIRMYTIYHDVFINADRTKVFQAISQPSEITNWWALRCSGKVKLGAEYNYNFTDKYDWYGELCELELNTSFFIKMTKSDPDWDPTTFGFILQDHKDGTMLSLEHRNWSELNHEFKNSSYAWAVLLNGLKKYLEKGIILPFEERG